MRTDLTKNEMRVIGCLMEKSVVTPDLYPLTLNALTNACNQKSSRNPVMSLSPGEVQHTVRLLEEQDLVMVEEGAKRGTEKYKQRFCNTRYSDLQFNAAEFSIITLMLLRGPQTPGELRAHSGRLHSFEDNNAVVDTLNTLMDRDTPLAVQLPRTPGRKDSEYTHLFAGPVDLEAYAEAAKERAPASSPRTSVSELEQRVSDLEAQVAELKQTLSDLID